MARYELSFRSGVAKDLRGIHRADVEDIMARIESLREEQRPPGCERVSAQERYRVRQGRFRILYTIDDPERVVEVVKAGHRREVYRDPIEWSSCSQASLVTRLKPARGAERRVLEGGLKLVAGVDSIAAGNRSSHESAL